MTSELAVQPEVLFSRRRVRLGVVPPLSPLVEGAEVGFVPTVLGMEADYLEVPVLLRLDLGDRGVPV